MLYIAVLIYILVLIYKYDYKEQVPKKDLHYKILCVVFILISGLSYRIGIDVTKYEDTFNTLGYYDSIVSVFKSYDFQNGGEPFWLLLNYATSAVFHSFVMLKLIIAIFLNTVIFWFVKKHSSAWFTVMLLYAILYYLHFNFEVLRESIAVGFFLLGLDGLIKDKPDFKRFYLFAVCAIFFHRFAFVVVIFPLIKFVKNGIIYIVLLVATVFASGLITDNFALWINMLFGDTSMTQSLSAYFDDTANTSNLNGYIYFFFTTVIPIYYIMCQDKDVKNKLFVSYGLVYIIVSLMNFTSITLFYRILDYLAIPAIIALSFGIKNGVYSNSLNSLSKYMCVILLVLMLGSSLYKKITSDRFSMYYPYSSVLTKEVDQTREKVRNYYN